MPGFRLPTLPLVAAITLSVVTLLVPTRGEAQVEVRGFANGGLLTNGFPAGTGSPRPLLTGALGNDPTWHFGWRSDTQNKPYGGYWPNPTNHYSFDPNVDLSDPNDFPGRLPSWLNDIRDVYFGDNILNIGATRYARNSGPWPDWEVDGGFTGTIRSSSNPAVLPLVNVAWSTRGTYLNSMNFEPVAEFNNQFVFIPAGGSIVKIYNSPAPGPGASVLILRVSPSPTNPDLSYHWYKFAHTYFNLAPASPDADIAVIAGNIEVLGGTGVFANYFNNVVPAGDSYGGGVRTQPISRFPGIRYNDINFLGDPDPYNDGVTAFGDRANLAKYLTWEVNTEAAPDGFGSRTIGYWKNHSAGRVAADVYPTALCPGVVISSDADACSILWANVARTSTGARRSELGQARIKLAQQLLAVIFNEGVFGSNSVVSALISNAKAALCGTNLTAINGYHSLADQYNNDPDNHSADFPNGTGYPSDGSNKAPNGCTSLADEAFFQ